MRSMTTTAPSILPIKKTRSNPKDGPGCGRGLLFVQHGATEAAVVLTSVEGGWLEVQVSTHADAGTHRDR